MKLQQQQQGCCCCVCECAGAASKLQHTRNCHYGLAAQCAVQVCISHVLQQHGALVFALMMTTRQCASVLLSSLLFGHALTLSQW